MSAETQELIKAIRSLEQSIKSSLPKDGKPSSKTSSNIGNETITGRSPDQVGINSTNEQVTVYIRVVFLKIGEIDTLKENYAADVFIQGRWREPKLDGKLDMDTDSINWNEFWTPQLRVENVFGEPKEKVWYTVSFDEGGRSMVYEKHRISASFLEYLELNEFPFDTQDLTITVGSSMSEAAVALEEDLSEICGINVQSFVDEQEWKLHNHIEIWKKITTRVYENAKFKYPALSAACRASRRPGFFIWNILFVMLFICSLAFTTFTVKISLPQNRLQLSFILLLTTVTFKLLVSQSLPRISYLTYLDKYILTSMTILCLICVWHSVVPLLHDAYDEELATTVDNYVCIVLAIFFVGFQVGFVLLVSIVAKHRTSKFIRKDAEHEEKLRIIDSIQIGEKGTNKERLRLTDNNKRMEDEKRLEERMAKNHKNSKIHAV